MAEANNNNNSESLQDEVDSSWGCTTTTAHSLNCSNVSNYDAKLSEISVLDAEFVKILLEGDLDQLNLLYASHVKQSKDSFKNMSEELKEEESMNISRDENYFEDKSKNTNIYSTDWKTNEEKDYANMKTERENVINSQKEMTLTNSRKDETTVTTKVVVKMNKDYAKVETKGNLHLLDEEIPPPIPPRQHRKSRTKSGERLPPLTKNEENNHHEPIPPKRIIRKKITHVSYKHELSIFGKSFLISFLSSLYFLVWTGLGTFYPGLCFLLTPKNHPDEDMRTFVLNFMNIIQFSIWGILVYSGYTRKEKQAPSFGFRKLLILPLLVEMVLLFAFLLTFCYEITIDDRSPWDPTVKFVVPILANTILFSTHIYYYMNRPEKIVYESCVRGERQNQFI